uniref:MmyB family transcriptional regulator n=1 Tax=Streptomyces tubercidicus TaxID=47759 RepID=UPI0030E03627
MNKDALYGLLESRRALIDPASVGLERPQRQGRRAPGLSQDQVDQIAGYGNRTYNRLINGTFGTPSFDLLRAYACALRLTEQEWFAMCRYARGDDPNSPLHARSGLEVPGMWQDVIDGIRHMAYITDQSYRRLGHNEAFAALFPHTGPPTDMMRWMCLDDEARGADDGTPGVLTDWETVWAPYVLPQLRAARAALPGDEHLADTEQLVISDPRAGALYEKRETAQVHPDGQERPVLHPTLGPCWAQICAAEPLSSPNARVMIVKLSPGATPSQIRRPHLHA